MDQLTCSRCGAPVQSDDKKYQCECFTVYRQIAGKTLDYGDIQALFTKGETEIIHGFRSKNGNSFSARLLRKNNKPSFDFGCSERNQKSKVVVQVLEPGLVELQVFSKSVALREEIHFGLVSPQLTACYGAIAGCKIVLYGLGNESAKEKLMLETSNLLFTKYVLKIVRPRHAQIREGISYLWEILDGFSSWTVRYVPAKRPRLKGTPHSERFPRGIFPWLDAEIARQGDKILVKLSPDPAVCAQFTAAIKNVTEIEHGVFVVPPTVERAVCAWVRTVGKAFGDDLSANVKKE